MVPAVGFERSQKLKVSDYGAMLDNGEKDMVECLPLLQYEAEWRHLLSYLSMVDIKDLWWEVLTAWLDKGWLSIVKMSNMSV